MSEKQLNSPSFLKISNSPLFSKFLHYCCDEIIEGKSVDWRNNNDDIEWTIEDINKSKAIVKDFFHKSIIHDKFERPELISEAVFNVMQNCYETRRESIQHNFIKARFIEAEHNLLENVDWKIKWVLGNSMLPSYKEPILQLNLGCSRMSSMGSKPKQKIIDFEMNIEQVDHLITVLESALGELNNDD
ncbi:uncharacterized protein LOC123313399 [Coccinella septempunctata]|uniref:uncharacterized protein LOC123313399 n=1 Tax=Coccinella septempunctata TaxID=41139 RepID=UPI001D0631F1|nr:uncharacterized protein LOC123313399 [Coccinella septempunctata]